MIKGCQGLFGRLFGHKYAGFYDLIPPNISGGSYTGPDAEGFIYAMTTKRLHVIRCTRCGAEPQGKEKP
jgi:hypothetical protein